MNFTFNRVGITRASATDPIFILRNYPDFLTALLINTF